MRAIRGQRAWRWCQRCKAYYETRLNHHHEDTMRYTPTSYKRVEHGKAKP